MKYFFTSVNNSYIPKAKILVDSIKKIYKESFVYCVLSDEKREDIDYSSFDKVLIIKDLDIPTDNLDQWIFSHNVVELCTAVKPFAFKKIFLETGCSTIVYLDPDTVVFSKMEELYYVLKSHQVVLTPHVSIPANEEDDILDGELLGCLRHGVFNLGFLAINNYGEGKAFLNWWADRCFYYCYDDGMRGLFTDQRWIDLAPCFFENIHILRNPGYNVATWNLYYRNINRNKHGQLTVNDTYPLRFFHFSGFDIGTHEIMLKKHAPNNNVLHQMSREYVKQQELHGQKILGNRPGFYDYFSNGDLINRETRIQYRENIDIKEKYPDPYINKNYYKYINEIKDTSINKNTVVTDIIVKSANNNKLKKIAKKILPSKIYTGLKRYINYI